MRSGTIPPGKPAPRSLVQVEYRQKLILVGALLVTLFVTAMNQSIVATAAQNIVADIGGFELFTWLFAGFSLVSAMAVPIVGKLNDMFGSKRVIIISLVLFLLSTGACGLAANMPQLIAARAIQGAGFAGVLGSNWIVMAALWPPRDRAKWLGVMSAGFTASGVVGPIVGGVVSDVLSWRWVFFVNLPIGAVALYLLVVKFPRLDREAGRPAFDYPGAVLFAAAAGLALMAMSLGGETLPWTSPALVGMLAVASLSLAAFIYVESRAGSPLLPLHLFRHRVFSAAMAGSLTVTISFVVSTVFLPLLVIGAMGLSATESAIPLMTMAVGVAIGSNMFGQALSRFGYTREIAMTGMVIAAAVLWWLSMVSGDIGLGTLATATVFLGLGISGVFTSFTAPVQNAMPEESLGIVTSSLQFARVFGMALGASLLGAVLLASLGVEGDAISPEDRIRDPEVVVSEERLAEVYSDFMQDPFLGQIEYDRQLAASRRHIADALSVVFRVASIASATGLVTAFLAFTGTPARTEPA